MIRAGVLIYLKRWQDYARTCKPQEPTAP
jgi:hypothetical protein